MATAPKMTLRRRVALITDITKLLSKYLVAQRCDFDVVMKRPAIEDTRFDQSFKTFRAGDTITLTVTIKGIK